MLELLIKRPILRSVQNHSSFIYEKKRPFPFFYEKYVENLVFVNVGIYFHPFGTNKSV